jgi:hypothetical protein
MEITTRLFLSNSVKILYFSNKSVFFCIFVQIKKKLFVYSKFVRQFYSEHNYKHQCIYEKIVEKFR